MKDTLVCSDSTSLIAVIDHEESVFLVYPERKDSMFLMKKYEEVNFKTSGRNGIITSTPGLILHINEHSNYLILGDSCEVKLSSKAFPMNRDTFFFIQYMYEGEVVNKKLGFEGKYLIISKKTLFTVIFEEDEKYGVDTIIQISPEQIKEFKFRYYNQGKDFLFIDTSQPDDLQKREFIPIKLVFLDDEELREKISFFLNALTTTFPEDNQDKLLGRIKGFLQVYYKGKIEEKNFKKWIERNRWIFD